MTLKFNHIKTLPETNLTLFEKFEFKFNNELTEIMNIKPVEILPHVINMQEYKKIGTNIEKMKKEFYEKQQIVHTEKSQKFIFVIIIKCNNKGHLSVNCKLNFYNNKSFEKKNDYKENNILYQL